MELDTQQYFCGGKITFRKLDSIQVGLYKLDYFFLFIKTGICSEFKKNFL